MKISKITMCNFRCFYGTHTIEFDTDGKITLLYGLSGAGKSSLLQFVNWVLYNKNDFSEKDDKGKIIENYPMYNMRLDDEYTYGSTFEVRGTIEFSHENEKYQLIRSETFNKGFKTSTKDPYKSKFMLQYCEQGSWVEYPGNVVEKINEIVPSALSKYFFVHGEKLDILNNEDSELKAAIYKMFGLTQYKAAIEHLGSRSEKQTIIRRYYDDRNKALSTAKTISDAELKSLYDKEHTCGAQAVAYDNDYKVCKEREEYFKKQADEVMVKLGQIKSSETYSAKIQMNNTKINTYESKVSNDFHDIGNILYKSIPFMLLSRMTGRSVSLLAKEVENGGKSSTTVFNNLKKDLLKEILDKNICICDRCLDSETRNYIQSIVDSMPPDSYSYQLKQFASKSKIHLENALDDYDLVDGLIRDITELRQKCKDLDDENHRLTEEQRRIPDTREMVKKYEEYVSKSKEYKAKKDIAFSKRNEYAQQAQRYKKEYERIVGEAKIRTEFDNKISILEEIRNKLENQFNQKINQTVKTLENSIYSVYEKISTRHENQPQFLNQDFSLRRVTRTGGQEVIDVYSYIIGMINALHQLDASSEEKEFPIIIDAPFSHTDVIQSTAVFGFLPKIASQVVMLSLELTKFKNEISPEKVGKTYLILTDDNQKLASIKACTIEEMLEKERQDALLAANKGGKI